MSRTWRRSRAQTVGEVVEAMIAELRNVGGGGCARGPGGRGRAENGGGRPVGRVC